jgi:hypothetical protein
MIAKTLLGAALVAVAAGWLPGAAAQQTALAPGACSSGVALVGGAGAAVPPQTAQGSSRTLSLAQCRAYCEQLAGCLGLSYRQDALRRVDERGFPAAAGDAEATCALFWNVAGTSGAPGTTSCLIARAPRAGEGAAFSKFRDAIDRIDREVRQDMVRPPRPCTILKTC